MDEIKTAASFPEETRSEAAAATLIEWGLPCGTLILSLCVSASAGFTAFQLAPGEMPNKLIAGTVAAVATESGIIWFVVNKLK